MYSIQIEWGWLLGCFFWYSQIAHIIKTRIICTRKMLLGTVHYLWAGGRRFWGVYYDSGLDNEFDEGLDEESLWEWFIDFRGLSLFIGMGGLQFFHENLKKITTPLSDRERIREPPIGSWKESRPPLFATNSQPPHPGFLVKKSDPIHLIWLIWYIQHTILTIYLIKRAHI